MIIRKKIISNKKASSSSNTKSSQKGNIIKKEDIILDVEKVENTNPNEEPIKPVEITPKQVEKIEEQEEFEKIDISSIEFKERVERRRGDRRRGYRRIDERSLVSRAQQEANNIKELAAREGYKNGFLEAQNELTEIKKQLLEYLSMKDEIYEKFFPHIMEISLEIAKKIIKKETELNEDILKDIFEAVLDELNSDVQRLEVKVNPLDLEFASVSLPEVLENKKLNVRLSISKDDSVEKGSCVVIANNGVIDANFKTQLAVLQNTFGIYKGGV